MKKLLIILICFCFLGFGGCKVDEDFSANIVSINGNIAVRAVPEVISSPSDKLTIECFIPLIDDLGIHRTFKISYDLLIEFIGKDYIRVNLELDLSKRYLKYRIGDNIIFSIISHALADQIAYVLKSKT